MSSTDDSTSISPIAIATNLSSDPANEQLQKIVNSNEDIEQDEGINDEDQLYDDEEFHDEPQLDDDDNDEEEVASVSTTNNHNSIQNTTVSVY